MAESFQKRRNRQRRTRVNIEYEVHTGDAIESKELPFVMGVMADLAGDGAADLKDLKDREFIEIGPDNFDKVLKAQKPKLTYAVDNKLSEDGGKLGVELKFDSFDDFSPDRVAMQVDPLRELLDKRRQLTDLRGKLAANYKLDQALQAALGDDEKMAKLKAELEAAGTGETEGDNDGE
jgi:type VI secretion system protein ImpB